MKKYTIIALSFIFALFLSGAGGMLTHNMCFGTMASMGHFPIISGWFYRHFSPEGIERLFIVPWILFCSYVLGMDTKMKYINDKFYQAFIIFLLLEFLLSMFVAFCIFLPYMPHYEKLEYKTVALDVFIKIIFLVTIILFITSIVKKWKRYRLEKVAPK